MIKVNGIELGEFDIYDLEMAEKFNNELEIVGEVANTLEGLSTPEVIRIQCNAIFKMFNNFFGEGTDKKIFGEKVNLVTCLKALDEFVSQVRKQKEEIEKIYDKYSPNRADRRTKK